MRILFGALHFGSFRNYEPAIVRLAAEGHDVHLAADIHDVTGGQALVERLAAAHPNIRWSFAPSLQDWPWLRTARQVRHGLESARFAAPEYDALPKYRNRSEARAPRIVTALARRPGWRNGVMRWLEVIERGIPVPSALVEWLRAEAPDVVLLASVTSDGAPQLDHLKAALSLGLPASLPIYSWDHLSGKAVLHIPPSQVLVWNDTQRREALEMHGLPADRIEVTGAYGYEQWFERTPSRTREQFCGELGFDAARPLLMYVCSVLSRPAPPEAPFVLDWIRALRASGDARLASAGIVIRPHPERMSEWDAVDLAGLGPVTVRGRNPIDPGAKAEYFDSLFHSEAVVGIITSAFIEAAVVGKPSLTVEAAQFREHQDGAPHYHYLSDPRDGLLIVARDFAEHTAQMAGLLSGDQAPALRTRRFVDAFVRSPQPGVTASQLFVQAIEKLAAQPRPAPERFGSGVSALAARAVRAADRLPGVRPWLWNAQDAQINHRIIEEREQKVAVTTARRERQEREDRERAERERQKAVRVREKAERIAARERERADTKRSKQRARRSAEMKGELKKRWTRFTGGR